jgi:hypothetical protein
MPYTISKLCVLILDYYVVSILHAAWFASHGMHTSHASLAWMFHTLCIMVCVNCTHTSHASLAWMFHALCIIMVCITLNTYISCRACMDGSYSIHHGMRHTARIHGMPCLHGWFISMPRGMRHIARIRRMLRLHGWVILHASCMVCVTLHASIECLACIDGSQSMHHGMYHT